MKNWQGFIKSMLVGGIVFLIPAIIVVVALGKLIGVLKAVAKTPAPFFGIKSVIGGIELDLLAITVTVLLCLVAGLLAKRASAKRMREELDSTLLSSVPRDALSKGFASGSLPLSR